MNPYDKFLVQKSQTGAPSGFKPVWMPSQAFDFQAFLVDWHLWMGRSACFADCGMGKTLIESIWAENVVRKTNKRVLILNPLAVAQQTVTEGEKFGICVTRSNDGAAHAGITVTNYEKLHHFDPNDFIGVVCDESSCLKAFDGKRRDQVTEFLRTIPYRLMATATAAPNDYIELGTTSEALGIMGQVDMLNRYFRNDNNTSDMRRIRRHAPSQGGPSSAGWRFRGHAEIPFWKFVTGWSRSGRRPSDFGPFPDARFSLPRLIEREHIVETRQLREGMLLPLPATNMREEKEERRITIQERCEKAAELVAGTGQPFIIWCQLNPEGDLLERLIPDAVQISGRDSDDAKEAKYAAFLSGEARGMISKQKIGGWGLNCQHCAHVVEFASHSFEAHYQGVRRCWRFGQTRDVINDIIATEGERGAMDNMQRKAVAADRMFSQLVQYMHQAETVSCGYSFDKQMEAPSWA